VTVELATAVISVLLAVVGFLLRQAIVKRIDELSASNQQLRDRVTTLEAEARHLHEKVTQLDARRHRYQVDNNERIDKLQQWITEKVI